MRTTSGGTGPPGDRLEPVGRLRHHLDVGLVGKQHPEARPHHRLVVDDEHADGHEPEPSRGAAPEEEAAGVGCTCGHVAAVDLHPLANADEAVPEAVGRCRARRRRRAPPRRALSAYRTATVGVLGPGVLESVGEALLQDPVGRQLEPGGQRRPVRRNLQVHVQPGGSHVVHAAPPGRAAPVGHQRRAVALAPHRAEQPPHLGERSAARLLDVAQRFASSRPESGMPWRTAPTCSTITLIAWATTSCSSRAIRARSSATATRAADSRSRSAWPRALRGLGLLGSLAQREADQPGDGELHRDEQVSPARGPGRCTRPRPPPATTTTRPTRAWRPLRRFPSRSAAPSPAMNRPGWATTSRGRR